MRRYVEPETTLVKIKAADIVTFSPASPAFSGESQENGSGDFYDISDWYDSSAGV